MFALSMAKNLLYKLNQNLVVFGEFKTCLIWPSSCYHDEISVHFCHRDETVGYNGPIF